MCLRGFFAFISLMLCSSIHSAAQQFPIRKLTVEDGVGHPIVYRTMQTSDGYLWFSTDNGLTRYDGTSFRNFTTEDGLPSNFIFDVAEWNNTMYVSSLGGGIVTYENGKFRPAFDSSANAPLHPIEIRVTDDFFLVVDRFKDLFILKDSRFHQVTPSDLGLKADAGLHVFNAEIYDGVAYIATNLGLYTYSSDSFSRVNLKVDQEHFIHRVTRIADSRILIVINDKLMEYDLKTHENIILYQGEVLARFTRVKIDNKGNIWLSTVNGNLYILTRTSSGYRKLKVFNDIVINDLFEDREKNMWLSTYGEGVWLIQSTRVRNHPIKGYIVSDLGYDPATNHLLLTTVNAGLKVFRLRENHFLEEVQNSRFPAVFANDIFLGPVTTAGDKYVLLGASHTLARLHKSGSRTLGLKNPITTIYADESRNRIWIGCRFALWHCDSSLQRLTPVPGFEHTVIRSMEKGKDGRTLIGTDAGLFIENGSGFEPFPSEDALQNANINALYFDHRKKILWAGTNAGLARVKDGRLTLVNNPLTRIRCNSITGDGEGNMFIGSVGGLIFYDGRNFEILSTNEGLTQANVIRVRYHEDKKVLTLLSSNSLSTIDTEYFPDFLRFKLPEMLIESITTEDERHTYSGKVINLYSPAKQLNIRLSTPQIRNREKVAYQYRMNDKAWTTFNGNEIALHSLPKGEMTITIKASKINNPSDSKILKLLFYIPPPFYLRWWFIALSIVVIGLSFAFLVVYYSRKKHHKLLEENRRLDVEHKALRNLLNPHFLYNAINSIHAFILQNDQRQTLGYLSKFSQLVRLNLELLSSDQVTLDKEIKNIGLYLEFEKLRFTDKLNYAITIDPALNLSDISIPSFIIQPFVENAIWHGLLPRKEGGDLNLRVRRQDQMIHIIIEDNGIGIKESIKHPKAEINKKTSMGINIIYERFELMKKVHPDYRLDVTDKSDLNGSATGTGTIITITIPADATQNL